MSVRSTSIEAYQKITSLGLLSNRRLEVYDALFHIGPCTANQIHKHLYNKKDIPIQNQSNIGTRLGELRELGCAEEVGHTTCPVTGMKVILWEVTDKLPGRLSKKPLLREVISSLEAQVKNLREENDRLRSLLSGSMQETGKAS